MRPIRAILLILCSLFFTSLLLLVTVSVRGGSEPTYIDGSRRSRSKLRALFSFQNPASLFVPTATIRLTDDNSTSFAARPAAFGPLLPEDGLTGQIWIGSGFDEDSFRGVGVTGSEEGELGCGDIPGWYEDSKLSRDIATPRKREVNPRKSEVLSSMRPNGVKTSKAVRGESETGLEHLSDEDGTDDHLQRRFVRRKPEAGLKRGTHTSQGQKSGRETADIQTMQESAEIHGKIVLLSRGGCGFAEKIKWAQRRGAHAVIVGDNLRGGPLVRMYANGDTSNITIPSLFTSHMTAHLLASLIPSGLMMPPHLAPPDEVPGDLQSDEKRKVSKSSSQSDPRTFTRPSNQAVQTNAASKRATTSARDKVSSDSSRSITESFLESLGFASASSVKANHDMPNERLSWRQVKNFEEAEAWRSSTVKKSENGDDSFVIGVHDWRDPDVVSFSSSAMSSSSPTSSYVSPSSTSTSKSNGKSNYLKGGSIIPGSGVYEKVDMLQEDAASSTASAAASSKTDIGHATISKPDALPKQASTDHLAANIHGHNRYTERPPLRRPNRDILREGLWVTLSPTNLNASPFFNTLFVLVVSPLVTLAAVYAMLLLRSRIRRRRWRAPKSVVERLPVRIYQALSTSTQSNSSATSPVREEPNQSTPLLSESRAFDNNLGRVRSQTICGSSGTASSPSQYGSLGHSLEKIDSGLSRWRRRYGGKQVECVVCLEEYVDGVSKVMSLPCGHEFHVDCITPWLTTRRRTCPICKGDVVRSMRRGSDASQREPRPATTEADIQTQAAETTNQSPSASVPVPNDHLNELVDASETSRSSSIDRGTPTPTSWLGRGLPVGLLSFANRPTTPEHDTGAAPDRNR